MQAGRRGKALPSEGRNRLSSDGFAISMNEGPAQDIGAPPPRSSNARATMGGAAGVFATTLQREAHDIGEIGRHRRKSHVQALRADRRAPNCAD